MARSNDYTMNINIKSNAQGLDKTSSEITKLNKDMQSINGKSIDIKVNLTGSAIREIQSLTRSIGSISKSLDTLSTKGLQTIEQGFSGASKSAQDLGSSVGNLQSTLDSISAKGLTSIQDGASTASKGLQDVSSAAGTVSSALDTVDGKGLDDIASSASSAVDQLTELAGKIESVSSASGFGDNWNNSYGGRYGGMRYTGQGMGISDITRAIGNGKNSYELTIENAMNKTRNMAVAKSWNPEDGISGMDAYWALDKATDNSLMSLNTLAAGINATAATTGASAKDIQKHAQDFADFGTMVLGLGYTEDVAQTAVMKLGRGLHGTFAALDQYGITKESLTGTGKWHGDENDLDGFMEAVSVYSKGMSDNLLKTTTGQVATLGKSASLGGYALGAMEAQAMGGVIGAYKTADDALRTYTKSMGWGADVVDNFGQRVLSKQSDNIVGYEYNPETGKEDKPVYAEESVYVDANKHVVDDEGNVVYENEAAAIADGFSQKKTGFSLSTLIIGADQVIGTYKTLKDTVLGFYAELRDLKTIKQVGLRNIFKNGGYQRDAFGNLIPPKDEVCSQLNPDCPQNSAPSTQNNTPSKKKKGRFSRWKDSIGNKIDSFKSSMGNNNVEPPAVTVNKTDSILHPNAQKGMMLLENNADVWSTMGQNERILNEAKGVYADGDFIPSTSAPVLPQEHVPPREATYKTPTEQHLRKQKVGMKQHKKSYSTLPAQSIARNYNKIGSTHMKKPSGDWRRPFANKWQSPSFYQQSNRLVNPIEGRIKGTYSDNRYKRTSLNPKNNVLAQQRKGIAKYGKDTNSGKRLLKEAKLRKQTEINPKNLMGTSSFFNRMDNASNNSKAARSARRSTYANKYNGYMKNTRKAMYDVKDLKHRAGKYIDDKKKFVKQEYGKGLLRGDKLKQSWGEKGRAAPYKAWGKTKKGLSAVGTRLDDSFLGNQYRSLKSQGAFVKNSITGSRAWKAASSQIGGNAGAMMGMMGNTRVGKAAKNSRVGQAVSRVKERGVKSTIGGAASRAGGAIKSGGAKALSATAGGVSKIAGGLGKVGGIVSGIGGAFMGLLGPIGAVIMGVTLITGLLDAMGVDWMGPLQTAFGGAAEAMQPLIQGFGQWLSDTATQIGPIITQIAQGLAPVLGALGSLISGNLATLGKIFGPILDGIGKLFSGGDGGSIFDGLAGGLEGLGGVLEQLGPVADSLWDALGKGAEGVGGFLGGVFDGVGMYITHIVDEIANTIGGFVTTIATAISGGISMIYSSIINGVTGLAGSIASGITLIGTSISTSITGITTATSAGIMAVASAIGGGITLIATSIGTSIMSIATAWATGITTFALGISNGILMIGGAIATVLGSIWGTLASGIGSVVSSISSAITGVITTIGATLQGIINSIVTGIQSVVDSLVTGLQTVSSTLTTIGSTVSDLVVKFGELGVAVTGFFFAVLNGKFDEIKTKIDAIKTSATGLAQQFTTMSTSVTTMQAGWTAIQTSVMMISTGLLQTISYLSQMGTILGSIAPVVAAAMAQSLAAIQQFGASAIQIMTSTAVGMSAAFAGNFHIAAATDAEMAGAYAALCAWGDLIVAKAGQIAADATAKYQGNMGIHSPGYIWRMTQAEFIGTLKALTRTGSHLVTAAGNVAKGIVGSWMSEQEGVNYNPLQNVQQSMPSTLTLPDTNVSFASSALDAPLDSSVPISPIAPLPVDLPQLTEPKLVKDIRMQTAQNGETQPVVFNHYGDVDTEERMNKMFKFFGKKMSFENKRAGRTA